MKASVVLSGLTIAVFLAMLASVEKPSGDPINPVIGDESFRHTFDRSPTADDADLLRIRTHLAYVEQLLRAVDDSPLPADLRTARRRNLDLLRRYWEAALFPAGEDPDRRRPTFIDDDGRRCAVAYLVEASLGAAAVARINDRFRNAYIADMDDPALADWIAGSGLTHREVMTIQPSYSGYRDMHRWDLVAQTSALYLNRVAGTDTQDARRVAGVDAKLQLIDLASHVLLGGEAAVGSTLSDGPFYRLGLRAGVVAMSNPTLLFTAGYAVDGVTGAVARASTVPFGVLFSFDTTRADVRRAADEFHERLPDPFVQLRAEAAWIATGRPQSLDWSAALDLVWRLSAWNSVTRHQFRARDLIASVTVTDFAGTIYAGLAVGFGYSALGQPSSVGFKHTALSQPDAPYW